MNATIVLDMLHGGPIIRAYILESTDTNNNPVTADTISPHNKDTEAALNLGASDALRPRGPLVAIINTKRTPSAQPLTNALNTMLHPPNNRAQSNDNSRIRASNPVMDQGPKSTKISHVVQSSQIPRLSGIAMGPSYSRALVDNLEMAMASDLGSILRVIDGSTKAPVNPQASPVVAQGTIEGGTYYARLPILKHQNSRIYHIGTKPIRTSKRNATHPFCV